MPPLPKTIICIAGPTASGKSSAAIALAQKHDGVVINADSMQVYKELSIVTARPSHQDEALVPHRLYGHISGTKRYSTGQWAKDIRTQIDEAKAAKKVPIIIGGTGLYFRALIDGLAVIPPVPENISNYWRTQAAKLGAAALHDLLTEQDPVMAQRLKAGDTQRLTRALEVLAATGKSLSFWQQQKDEPVLSPLEQQNLIKLVIAPPRALLYKRINQRFAWMVDAGALEEVQKLAKMELDKSLPLMRALGVPELMTYLSGDCTKQEAIEQASMMSRRYAKRQMTWLRKNMTPHDSNSNNITWNWFLQQDKESATQEILSFI